MISIPSVVSAEMRKRLKARLVQLGALLKGVPSKSFEAWEDFWIAREDAALARQKAAVAKAFNDLYTFNLRLREDQPEMPGVSMFGIPTRGGYAWMCPSCNVVHLSSEMSAFTGIQYPACCKHRAGHRLDEKIFVNRKHTRRQRKEFRLKGWRVPK